jgi:hypothetical protein
VPLLVAHLPATVLGLFIFGIEVSQNGSPTRITATYWLLWSVMLCVLAVVVALAVASGEHWLRRHPPRNRLDAVRPRGGLARLWRSDHERSSDFARS